MVAWARNQPGDALVLSVKSDNEHARALYVRHGFVDAGPSPDDPDERRARAVPVLRGAAPPLRPSRPDRHLDDDVDAFPTARDKIVQPRDL